MADLLQHVVEVSVEFVDGVRPTVGEAALGQTPHAFVGIEFGRVGRKGDQVQARETPAQLSDGDATVDRGVVPDDDDVTAQMPEQVTQEVRDGLAINVAVMELIVESHTSPDRADRDAADDRDPVATVAVSDHRRLSSRRPGPEQRRDQLEAALVCEDDVGTQPRGVFFTSGQVSRLHRSMASSSRSSARRSGFWGLHPSRLIRRPT